MQVPQFAFVAVTPDAPLRRYVERLWYARGRVTYGSEAILPDGNVSLMINFGDPFDVDIARSGTRRHTRDAWVVGPQRGRLLNRPLGETHMIGVTFRPEGAHAVLGLPVATLANDIVSLDDLWQRCAHEWRERLQSIPRPRDKLVRLQQLLMSRLRPDERRLSRIRRALAMLWAEPPRSVRSVCDALGVSNKHLIAQFRTYVGLPPKVVQRLHRFNQLIRSVDGDSGRWSDLAQACGYHDQAHMNRDFRHFSGVSPSEYLRRRAAIYGQGIGDPETAGFVPSPETESIEFAREVVNGDR